MPTVLPVYNGQVDNQFFNSARIQKIVETPTSILERTRPLTFLDRLSMVDANDDELFGRFTSKVIAADIIANSQKAVVHDAGKIVLLAHSLPNIKTGKAISQDQINMLHRWMGGGRADGEDAAFDWEMRFGEELIAGVRERENMMACSMMLDDFSYDRWGVAIDHASWGMPANLKVTPAQLWSLDGGATVNTNSDPLKNFFDLDIVDSFNYQLGAFDRITMAGSTFDLMASAPNFANKIWVAFSGLAFIPTTASINASNRAEMMPLAEKILKKEIVIDDKIFRTQQADGTDGGKRVLPLNKVILDRKSNGPREWDFGNGTVTESIVAGMIGSGITLGENPKMQLGGSKGPLAYYTAQDPALNPPGVTGWAVARAFPRKFIAECSAVLTVF